MLQRCCGMRLNTTGMVIGWLGVVLSLLSIILFSLCLAHLEDLIKAIESYSQSSDLDEETIRKALVIVIVFYLTINAINLVASSLLVLGTVKERHLLIIPWLINSGISLFFGVLYFIYTIVAMFATTGPFEPLMVSAISAGLTVGLHTLIWYAIYSLFKQIQATRELQQHLIPRNQGPATPIYTKI